MSNGFCIFAYNTDEISYIRCALICASYIKKNLSNNNVCLITDADSYNTLISEYSTEHVDRLIDDIVITDDRMRSNPRLHRDGLKKFKSDFRNSNKHKVFEYSPYDHTIMIDLDYIALTDKLDDVFERQDAPVSLFKRAQTITGNLPAQMDQTLSPHGIDMIWSTVIYFDKSVDSKIFFDLWGFVADNWEYYQLLYKFPKHMFRTDFAATIADNILSYNGAASYIGDLHGTPLINISQINDIAQVKDNGFVFYTKPSGDASEIDILTRIEREDIHVMNKLSLIRNYDKIIESNMT